MCMIDYAEPEECVTLLDKDVKARVEHKCDECGRVIKRGETYRTQSVAFDGTVVRDKTCAHCRVVCSWLMEECGGWLTNMVKEDITEHFQEGYGLRVAMLAAGMRAKWQFKSGRMMKIPPVPPTGDHHA